RAVVEGMRVGVDRCGDQCQGIVVVGGPGAAHALPGCSKRCRRLVGHHPGSALPSLLTYERTWISDLQGQLRTLVDLNFNRKPRSGLLIFSFFTDTQRAGKAVRP